MESLHSRVRVVWIARAVLVTAVLAVAVAAAEQWLVDTLPAAPLVGVGLLLAAFGIVHALLLFTNWGFELQEDALYLERGVVTFVETSVPFVRVQHVDTQFGPVERALGLSSVVVYTAGSRNADVRIPGLPPDRARRLQNTLRDLAVESEGEDAV